jgi:hypothetical protein
VAPKVPSETASAMAAAVGRSRGRLVEWVLYCVLMFSPDENCLFLTTWCSSRFFKPIL